MNHLLQQIDGQVFTINQNLDKKDKDKLNNINLYDLYRRYVFPNTEIIIDYDCEEGFFSFYSNPYCKKIYCITNNDKNFEKIKNCGSYFNNIQYINKKDQTLENIIVKENIQKISLLRLNINDNILNYISDESFDSLSIIIESILIEIKDSDLQDYFRIIDKLKQYSFKIWEIENKSLLFGFKVFYPEDKKRIEMEKFINE